MKVISSHENTHVLRFDRGEEVIAVLKKYCADNNIKAGYFSAIGAVDSLELAWYYLDKKEYVTKQYNEMLEIASVTGNVAISNDEHIIHAHGVFSTIEMTVAAHIMNMTVGITCEVILNTLPNSLNRQYDETTGLKLLS